MVRKPNGKIQLCGNFKVTVNPVLKTDIYPLPKPEDLFHAVNGGSKFSKLDLSEAFLQIELDEECGKMVVINTHRGLYQYKHLPFGLSCAPEIFQKIIDYTIADMPGVVCYLDNLIITRKTDQEHISNLQNTLDRLRTTRFCLKME